MSPPGGIRQQIDVTKEEVNQKFRGIFCKGILPLSFLLKYLLLGTAGSLPKLLQLFLRSYETAWKISKELSGAALSIRVEMEAVCSFSLER